MVVGHQYASFLSHAFNDPLKTYYQLDFMTVGGPQGLFYIQNGNVYSLDNMYPQDDARLLVKATGVPLAQFVQEVQLAISTTSTTTVAK